MRALVPVLPECCIVIGPPLAGPTSADRSVYVGGVPSFLNWRIPPSMTKGFVEVAAEKLTNQRVTI